MGYNIQHIDLQKPIEYNAEQIANRDNYFVIWWNSLPLGDFYLEKQATTSEAFIEKIIVAVKDAISSYTLAPVDSWMELLRGKNFDSFSKWMSDHIHEKIDENTKVALPISVIICTRNRSKYLRNCLQRLTGLNFYASEIIVVDNAPENDETETVVREFNTVSYVKEPNAGLDFARNAGIKHALNDIVAYIDDDAEPHHLWLYRVWETFQDELTAGMTGLVFPLKLDTYAQILFEKYWTFNRGFVRKTFDKKYIDDNTMFGAPVWEIGAGVNMAFRKKIFNSIGDFNVLLDAGAAGCNGDSEMWFRILANDYKMIYNPKAVVYHEHRADIKGLENQIFYYMRGNIAAALIQQSYSPESAYSKYISNLLKSKIRILIKQTLRGYWKHTKILRLETKGIISGIYYYYRTR